MNKPVTSARGGVRVQVYVQPRAGRSEIVGEHGGSIKVRLAAPPVDGAANAELIEFLARRLGIPRRQVALESGETSRRKAVLVSGLRPEDVAARLGLSPKARSD